MRPKFSPYCIADILRGWFAAAGSGTRRNGLRLGQYWINKYHVEGDSFPELFYAESPEVCVGLIWQNYCDWDKA